MRISIDTDPDGKHLRALEENAEFLTENPAIYFFSLFIMAWAFLSFFVAMFFGAFIVTTGHFGAFGWQTTAFCVTPWAIIGLVALIPKGGD